MATSNPSQNIFNTPTAGSAGGKQVANIFRDYEKGLSKRLETQGEAISKKHQETIALQLVEQSKEAEESLQRIVQKFHTEKEALEKKLKERIEKLSKDLLQKKVEHFDTHLKKTQEDFDTRLKETEKEFDGRVATKVKEFDTKVGAMKGSKKTNTRLPPPCKHRPPSLSTLHR